MLYNFKQFRSALETLGKAVHEPDYSEYVRDATIQRFEFTYETAWKCIKSVLSHQGIELRFPKELLQEAFASGWIKHPDAWEAMIEDRNLTTQTYQERTAEAVYKAITSSYYGELQFLLLTIEEVIQRNVRSSGQR